MRKGQKHKDESIEKIRGARSGKKWSEEVRLKISEAMKKKHAERKAASLVKSDITEIPQ